MFGGRRRQTTFVPAAVLPHWQTSPITLMILVALIQIEMGAAKTILA